MNPDEPKHERWMLNIILEVPLEQAENGEESARVGEVLETLCNRMIALITQDAEIQRLVERHGIDIHASTRSTNPG